jgi:hypothetical protein
VDPTRGVGCHCFYSTSSLEASQEFLAKQKQQVKELGGVVAKKCFKCALRGILGAHFFFVLFFSFLHSPQEQLKNQLK